MHIAHCPNMQTRYIFDRYNMHSVHRAWLSFSADSALDNKGMHIAQLQNISKIFFYKNGKGAGDIFFKKIDKMKKYR